MAGASKHYVLESHFGDVYLDNAVIARIPLFLKDTAEPVRVREAKCDQAYRIVEGLGSWRSKIKRLIPLLPNRRDRGWKLHEFVVYPHRKRCPFRTIAAQNRYFPPRKREAVPEPVIPKANGRVVQFGAPIMWGNNIPEAANVRWANDPEVRLG